MSSGIYADIYGDIYAKICFGSHVYFSDNDEVSEGSDEEYLEMRSEIYNEIENEIEKCRTRSIDDEGVNERAKRRRRDFIGAHNRLIDQYFAEESFYNEYEFRRRFRMQRSLFINIEERLAENFEYFRWGYDNAKRRGASPKIKISVALRQLAYGCPADSLDETFSIAESNAIECLMQFCDSIIVLYKSQYLRYPNQEDVIRLQKENAERGFPGMLGSVDCMHWRWKNCPKAWAGQFTGRSGKPTIVLEAVASKDLWIWHALVGLPGSLNDINIMHRSNIFDFFTHGDGPDTSFSVNGRTYECGYFLADGIYPQYATLVKTIRNPQTEQDKYFAKKQESVRKDVERAFGVLQARFAIVAGPARGWSRVNLIKIMKTCIILHNMIVEDERDKDLPLEYEMQSVQQPHRQETNTSFSEFIGKYIAVRSRETHTMLAADLTRHLWDELGKRNENLSDEPLEWQWDEDSDSEQH